MFWGLINPGLGDDINRSNNSVAGGSFIRIGIEGARNCVSYCDFSLEYVTRPATILYSETA